MKRGLSSRGGTGTQAISIGSSGNGEENGNHRPPSPGLPLHRDTSNTASRNMELHEGASASASSRRRAPAGSATPSTTAVQPMKGGAIEEHPDANSEKDYLIDKHDEDKHDEDELEPRTRYSEREKEKWSRLIPEDLSRRTPRHLSAGKSMNVNNVVSSHIKYSLAVAIDAVSDLHASCKISRLVCNRIRTARGI